MALPGTVAPKCLGLLSMQLHLVTLPTIPPGASPWVQTTCHPANAESVDGCHAIWQREKRNSIGSLASQIALIRLTASVHVHTGRTP